MKKLHGLCSLACVACERSGNFHVTAENPAGPWSDPVWLDSHDWFEYEGE